MSQVIDPRLVAVINQRAYAALQTVRRNAANTDYEFAQAAWLDADNVFTGSATFAGNMLVSGAIVVGTNDTITSAGSIVLSSFSSDNGVQRLIMGLGSRHNDTTGIGGVAIGFDLSGAATPTWGPQASGLGAICIGSTDGAATLAPVASGAGAVAIGTGLHLPGGTIDAPPQATGPYCIAIGSTAVASTNTDVAILGTATGGPSMALGDRSIASFPGAVCLGPFTVSNDSITATCQIAMGAPAVQAHNTTVLLNLQGRGGIFQGATVDNMAAIVAHWASSNFDATFRSQVKIGSYQGNPGVSSYLNEGLRIESPNGDNSVTTAGANVNMALLMNSVLNVASYGGGVGVVYVPNAATAPSTNPTAGYIQYGTGGGPQWRTSGGGVLGSDSLGNFSTSGTLAATFTAHSVLLGEGNTAVLGAATVGTSGRVLVDKGAAADPAFVAMSGDATLASSGALALATVNSNVGSFGASNAIPSYTVNAKGLITASGSNAVVAPAGTLTGTTLAANVVSSSLTTVGTIGTGTWNGTLISTTYGGSGVSQPTAHAVLLGGGSGVFGAATIGTAGRVLTDNGAGADPTFNLLSTVSLSSSTAGQVAYITGSGSIGGNASLTYSGGQLTLNGSLSAGSATFTSGADTTTTLTLAGHSSTTTAPLLVGVVGSSTVLSVSSVGTVATGGSASIGASLGLSSDPYPGVYLDTNIPNSNTAASMMGMYYRPDQDRLFISRNSFTSPIVISVQSVYMQWIALDKMGMGGGGNTLSPQAAVHVQTRLTNNLPFLVQATSGSTTTLAQLQNAAGSPIGNIGGTLFSHYANVLSTHTNGTFDALASDTVAANTFLLPGDALSGKVTLLSAGSGTATTEAQLLFAGFTIGDTGALAFASAGEIVGLYAIISDGTASFRATVTWLIDGITSQPIITAGGSNTINFTAANTLIVQAARGGTLGVAGDITMTMAKTIREPN